MLWPVHRIALTSAGTPPLIAFEKISVISKKYVSLNSKK
ncbi:hypothetical protein K788_0007629 [Paraburkholderia caribensis MBA4]|uniref:Uncharacterized protein n=1 Tax=Paraburkholderia caribensis MBA4 TaxID=1323664 RepID=A0A0P0RGI6_9BURK|nr:hypothetical protein K788_0007629 [Paraburkholderia caribensis MBA4]